MTAAYRQEQEALRVMQEAAAALDHVSAERDRYRDALRELQSPGRRLRIDQGRGVTAFIREVLL